LVPNKLVYLQALMICMYGRDCFLPNFSFVIISCVKRLTISVINRLINLKLYGK